MNPTCVRCGAHAKRVCGACEFIAYCGERCASLDWPQHLAEEPHAEQTNAMDLVWAPHLWLGGITALNELDAHRIDAVLTVIQRNARNDPSWLAQRVGMRRAWLWLSHHDDPSDDMSVDFTQATDFIHLHLSKGHNVLLHCHAGMSRSATMVAAYLLRFHATKFNTVQSAIAWLQRGRPIVNPNAGFLEQLEGWCIKWKNSSGCVD